MADNTAIEWTDATWNPVIGCTRVDKGCTNCYAEVMAARFSDPGQWGHGLATRVKGADGTTQYRWTGETRFINHALGMPLRWRKPRKIFVCSTSDLFGESVPDEWIDKVFDVMALAPHHTFQVLTKRPERARAYLTKRNTSKAGDPITLAAFSISGDGRGGSTKWPLPNVWLGTSISDQPSADLRIPELLATPAAVRFISAEPLLGPVDLTDIGHASYGSTNALTGEIENGDTLDRGAKIDWVIVGGESGQHARPMHPDWARSIRDQCAAAGTAFFFKQWGEWGAGSVNMSNGQQVFRAFPDFQTWVNKAPTWVNGGICLDAKGRECRIGADFMRARDEGAFPVTIMHRLGKKQNRNLLDGREHKDFPNARP